MGTVYSPFGDVPYPDEDAAYDVPAHLSALVEALDPKLIGEAYSTSDRDAKYFGAPAGFVSKVVNSPSHPTNPNELVGLYIKTGIAGIVTWYALYEPATTLVEVPLQLVDGFEPRDGTYVPTVFRENTNFVVLNGAVVRSNAADIVSGTVVAYLPDTFVPYRTGADYPISAEWGAAGVYKITVHQSDRSITYYGPDVAWAGFDGVRIRTL